MRTSLKFLLGMSSMLLMSGAVSAAPQLVPIIPFPGATTTTVFGIADDDNTIVGDYVDDAGTHGFYGTLDGNYTSFDFGDSGTTQPRAIDGRGTHITGFSNITATHCEFQEWEYQIGFPVKQITWGGNLLNGIAQGLNKKDVFAGDYCDSNGVVHGQLGQSYQHLQDVTVPFDSPYVGERGVNRHGMVVGFYVDPDTGLQLGTVVSGGNTTVVTYPDPNEVYTVFEGVNDRNQATGQWEDSDGVVHGFVYDIDAATFTEIDDPNAVSFTQAWGINHHGLMAVSSDQGSYIYCPHPVHCPGTGTALKLHQLRAAPAKLVDVLKAFRAKGHPAPLKLALPRGAAMQ